jgi:hypothetical protein
MDWAFGIDGGDRGTIAEVRHSTGALLVGRRTQDVEDRLQLGFYGGAFRGPFFVLRHDPPSDPPVVKSSAPITLAVEQLEGDERIGEVGDRPRVEPQRLGDLRSCHRLAAQPREQLELDCRQERLRRPEPHADLHDL